MMPLCLSTPSPFAQGVLPSGGGHDKPLRLRPGNGTLTARAIVVGGWRAGNRVLDLGCGDGASLGVLRRLGIDAIGLDAVAPSTSATALVIPGRGETMPFASASFDGVLAECSLSVMADPCAALAEAARVLKPDAALVVTDIYARGSAADRGHLPPCLAGIVTSEELARRVALAGLHPTLCEDHSDALKQLIGQILFEHGSLVPLWGDAPAEGDTEGAIRQLRPGYLLLAARRQGDIDRQHAEHGHG